MIELRRLGAFVAIAEEGHVTRAAARLGMQQPPLSRLLRGLEEELGVALVRRTPRGVEPTAAGLALLEEARAVLARAEGVAEAVRRAARGESGRLAVGFTGSSALHPAVPGAIRRYREILPGVLLALEEGGTGELVEGVRAGRLDAAFVRTKVGDAGLAVREVTSEAMVVALPAGHRLADEAGALRLEALSGEGFVLYRRPSGPGLYDAVVAACRRAGFSPRVVQEAPRLTATLSLVAAGLGLSLVPESMRALAVASVRFRSLAAGSGLAAPIYLVAREGAAGPVLARFQEVVEEGSASFFEKKEAKKLLSALHPRAAGDPVHAKG